LLGHDQGALLALAISLVLPDYLAGVIAICGCLPRISAWPLPDTDLMGMPYLLIYDEEDPELPRVQVLATADELRRKGGVPMLQPVTGARALGPGVARSTSNWLRRRNR
jgi:predicted esterase